MANISNVVAAQLSRAAYGKNLPPAGWTLIGYQETSNKKDSVSVYSNGTIAVMAFKGSDNVTNFKNDLLNSGYQDWKDLEPFAEKALSLIPGNLQVITTGHSLGGGLSQTFALKHNLDGYGQNALPVTSDALAKIASDKGLTPAAALSAYRGSRSFTEVNVSGDPATLYYYSLQSQVYLSQNPVTLPSPYAAMEVAGTVLTGTPLASYGAAMVAKAAASAHSIDTQIEYLGGTLTGAADNVLVDNKLQANAAYITNSAMAAYLDSSNNVTTADGTRVGVVLASDTSNAATYNLTIGDQAAKSFTVATGAGVSLNQNNAYGVCLAQTSMQLSGTNNNVFGEAGSVINIGGNGSGASDSLIDNVYATGATVNLLDSSRVNVFNANGTVNAGLYDNFGAYGGGMTVNGNNTGGIWVNGSNASGATKVNANGATISVVDSSSNVTINANNSTIYGANNASFSAYGSNLTVNASAHDSVVIGGNGKTGAVNRVNLQDVASCSVTDNSNTEIADNRSAANTGMETLVIGSNDNVKLTGTGDATYTMAFVQGSGTNVTVNAGNYYSNFVESGSNNLINLYGGGEVVKLHGTGSRVNLYSAGTKAELWGTNEQVYVPPNGTGQAWCFYGTNGQLVRVPLGGFGFAGNQQTVAATIGSIGSVASALHIGNDDVLGLDTAQRAQQQLQDLLQTPQQAVTAGGRWDHRNITWSVDSLAAGFSGKMGATEEQQIARAFDVWAAASGLTFTEVHGDSAADIKLGWSKLDTAHSGMVGYTSYEAGADGSIQSGVTIRVEDQAETALHAQNGELIYDGTDASLSQVLLHEIGHALGLADNAQAQSIESYYLNAGNRTLSVQDQDAVRALYSNFAPASAAATGSVDRLIQSMAAFASPSAPMLAQRGYVDGHRSEQHAMV